MLGPEPVWLVRQENHLRVPVLDLGELDRAKEVAGERAHKLRLLSLTERRKVTNINLFEAVAESEKEIINLVVRADVQGSVQVLVEQLASLTHDEVEVKVILSGVGEVVESDVELAVTSGATVIAYHVGTNTKARKSAERNHVEVRNYAVIYEVLDYVHARMESALSPEFNEEITGHAEIRRVFPSSRFGRIAGCMVLDGAIQRDNKMRLLRDGTVVHTGSLAGLRREADDAKEVRALNSALLMAERVPMSVRETLEAREREALSPHAMLASESKGRAEPEQEHDYRTAFQRDRDRILHCKAFRRLKGKTQVFLAPKGDHYRTRLTHTLEVAQISRTVARALFLNEDLAEAIALGHDLGHTPFGHAGEAALNELYPEGFRHFEQSLRIVDELEPTRRGRGLNLTHEVRDGIRLHSKGKSLLLGGTAEVASTMEGRIVSVDKEQVLKEFAASLRVPLTERERQRRELSRQLYEPAKRYWKAYLDGETRDPFYRLNSRT